jgi:hypothetical protein
MKKPKFTNKMAQVQPLQDLVMKVSAGTKITLRWKVSNKSKSKPWPLHPHVKNFSNDQFFEDPVTGDKLNELLTSPFALDLILAPQTDFTFELDFTVPNPKPNESSNHFCHLNLNLTNPLKNHDKFGDSLSAVIEILPKLDQFPSSSINQIEEEDQLENSEIIEGSEEEESKDIN